MRGRTASATGLGEGRDPRRLRAAARAGRGPCLTTGKSGQAPQLPLNLDNSTKPHSLQSAKCHHWASTGDTAGERRSEAEPREQEPPPPFMEGLGPWALGRGVQGRLWVGLCPQKDRVTSEPQLPVTVTLLGNTVFAGVIKVSGGGQDWGEP